MKLFEFLNMTILAEDKAEYLEKNLGHKLFQVAKKDGDFKEIKDAASIVAALIKIDPTPKQQFAVFIANMYLKGQFKLEDSARITKELKEFLRVKNRLANKDISSYKTLDQLYDALEPFAETTVATKATLTKEVKKSVTKVIDTPDFKVIIPNTEDAAKLYGAGTKWCTAADENCMFNRYNDQGPLYIIITKKAGKIRKFQLHYEADQFMNERDLELTPSDIEYLSSFPKYKDFLNMLIKKHYEPHFTD